ncbi:MAG: hypothetical protein R3Y54_13075 [Eubacteriales bacterium]
MKNKNGEFENFNMKFIANKYVPCFSFQSIIELRKSSLNGRAELYESFIELFSVFPCMMLYPYRQITQQEIAIALSNVDKKAVDMNDAMNAFTPLGKDNTYDFSIWENKMVEKLGALIVDEERENEETCKSWMDERVRLNKIYKMVLYPIFE